MVDMHVLGAKDSREIRRMMTRKGLNPKRNRLQSTSWKRATTVDLKLPVLRARTAAVAVVASVEGVSLARVL